MGVAVLHPQDCLPTSHPRKPLISPSPSSNTKSSKTIRTHPNRQKRAQNTPHTRPASTSVSKPQVSKPVMGQVKILKRGDQLTQTTPDPKTKTAAGGLYAGSSMCVASPPPSSVPLPVFVTKKIAAVSEATNELRKILRLEFS